MKNRKTGIDPEIEIGNDRIFDPARIYHVGVCVRDIDATVKFYTDVFGIGPFSYREVSYADATYYGERAGYRGKRAFAQMGAMMLELIELIDGPTIHDTFLKTHGEGIHHLGFEVDDLEASMAQAKRLGLTITQSFQREDGTGFAYYDSDRVGGTIFEVVEKVKS